MAEVQKTKTVPVGVVGANLPWAELAPKNVDRVRVMSEDKVTRKWEVIYKMAGLRNPSEVTRASLRLAVYVYLFRNGSTRVGEYSGEISLVDGHVFPAAVIVRAVGAMDMRRFMRGNAVESYVAMKTSKVIEDDPSDVAKAAELGIRAEDAFAMADWFDLCPVLTPSEKLAHEKAFKYRISRASKSRGNNTLEGVEDEALEDKLAVQDATGGRREAVF